MRNLFDLLQNKRILVFSPHPDDDCIGMGAAIFSFSQKNRLRIIYMTSGWRGVKGGISVNKKRLLREKEALEACRVLAVNKKFVKFLNLPFYDTGKAGPKDTDLVKDEIEKFKPDIIFACGESSDPHRTHGRCLKILKQSLKRLTFSPVIFFYRVWEYSNPREIGFFLPFTKNLMEKKIEAIKMHRSQLNPLFTKKRIKSFWQREGELNKKFALILKNEGLLKGRNLLFAEVFKTGPTDPEKYAYLRDKK